MPHPTEPTPSAPVLGRVNAWFFQGMDSYIHRKYRDRKERLFADLPDTLLELGPGVGANFRYLRPGTHVIAVEPNVHMHAGLRRAAEQHGIVLTIRGLAGDGIDLPDESVDAVISTLVLCTVPDAAATVRAVRRVLRPGGRYLCIEHVAAPPGTWLLHFQRAIFRPWRWFFEGCHTHRDLAQTLEEGGFSELRIEPFELSGLFFPVRCQIAAIAVK
jgi:SAM-dependent methyltransferase